ncbi:hypothetical protein ACHQM5_004252 [Ranunculus cassubicifolius]
MAADVTTLVRILNGYLDEQRVSSNSSSVNGGASSDLITRDLFGSSASSSTRIGSKDIDLDLQVPSGWEKRLDLKSGKVYLQRCNSPISSSSTTTSSSDHQQAVKVKDVQDLNYLPLTREDDSSLDLKLVPSYDYRSVCTLDKVKSALERAGKEESGKKRSSSNTSSEEEEGTCSTSSGGLFAGGCPSCLMYVMISKMNPKCPRCDAVVPVPPAMCSSKNKKPRLDLDLNLNLLSSSS